MAKLGKVRLLVHCCSIRQYISDISCLSVAARKFGIFSQRPFMRNA